MEEGTAKYAAVRDHLADRIKGMSPGDRLPAEHALCAEYGVSRITVRRAVEELVKQGKLVREQGRGTFVTQPQYLEHFHETFADTVLGLYRQQHALGRTVTTKVLRQRLVRSAEAAGAIGLSPADELLELERLRYVNDVLHQMVVTWLPAARFPDVVTHDFREGSLFDFLQLRYGVELVRNELLVNIDHATAREASGLGVPQGTCLLSIRSTVFDTEGTPVAFGITHNTPETSEIAINIGAP
ncbi:MAG: GntR family transcriptional regulator [Micropruina sp.]|uniref:GntR family transcriptional regulator n=1 Tax=Micropruina sp. TaxID=2737536 RepID=UPI0039E669F3